MNFGVDFYSLLEALVSTSTSIMCLSLQRRSKPQGQSMDCSCIGAKQLVQAGRITGLKLSNGIDVEAKSSMEYLGSLVHEDGWAVSEISRRVGMCAKLFRDLARVWSHTHYTMEKKLHVFNVLVITRLLYGMTALWIGKAGQQKLDGFQNSCLRRIAKIPPAYVSRISNKTVLQRLRQEPVSLKVFRQQLFYFQTVAASAHGPSFRSATFHGNGLTTFGQAFVRRVGRPRQVWADQLLQSSLRVSGSWQRLEADLADKKTWRQLVLNSTSFSM